MTKFKSHLWVTLFVLLLALSVWVGNEANRTKPVSMQEVDKFLEIERTPDEPLQLVDLRIGTQSVKNHIRPRFRDQKSKVGLDRASFKEKDDWFKRISLTLRNVSTRPVYGVTAFLYFKPIGNSMIFSMPLTASRKLRNDPLQPGAEIELTVSASYLNQTLENLKHFGQDASRTDVTFSLDSVIFSDELQWNRGGLVRPDPAMPDKWIPVDDPVAALRNKPSLNMALFIPASFKSAAPVKPAPVFVTCKNWHGSVTGPSCSGDPADCITKNELDDSPDPGVYSHQQVFGFCEDRRNMGLTCNTLTLHNKMLVDGGCATCLDGDGDGYTPISCGGTDCNDSDANVHPGAEAICGDNIDNACQGGDFCPEDNGITCDDGDDNDGDGLVDCEDPGCNHYCVSGCSASMWAFCLSIGTMGCINGQCYTPVVIDMQGDGIQLSNAQNGVLFNVIPGRLARLAWTLPNSDDAWLALDRNGNGTIDSGEELFGNVTPQTQPPLGESKHGFRALAEYDATAKGGNGDGLITTSDAIFNSLRLWQDKNHNGISEPSELRGLSESGVATIECNYKESKRTDEWGNNFRYRAKVKDKRGNQIGRWAWDVFLQLLPQ